MLAHWKRHAAIQQRIKRERSESVNVVGDDEIFGDGSTATGSDSLDDDLVVLRAVNLRAQQCKRRKPTDEDEVILLD